MTFLLSLFSSVGFVRQCKDCKHYKTQYFVGQRELSAILKSTFQSIECCQINVTAVSHKECGMKKNGQKKQTKKHVCWFIPWKLKAPGSPRLFWDSFISYILSCWALCVMAKADTIVERKAQKRRMNVLVNHTEITINTFHCGNKLWKCD